MSDIKKDIKKDIVPEKPLKIGALSKFSDLNRNTYRSFLLQKTEKLASALYVVTGFIPADDPVRSKLRLSALDLISQSAGTTQFNEISAREFGNRCIEIAALLEAAQYAGLISRMNATLICDEYANLEQFARANHTKISERETGYSTDGISSPKDTSSKGRFNVPEGLYKKLNSTTASGTASYGMNDRRLKILSLIKKYGVITIKDARNTLSDTGGKTVQRLLLLLVREGVLVKIGERRWSTYKLASAKPSVTSVDGGDSPANIMDAENVL
jgi:hypothetical protein